MRFATRKCIKNIYMPSIDRRSFLVRLIVYTITSTSRHLFDDLQSKFLLAFIVGWILTRTMRLFYLGMK